MKSDIDKKKWHGKRTGCWLSCLGTKERDFFVCEEEEYRRWNAALLALLLCLCLCYAAGTVANPGRMSDM